MAIDRVNLIDRIESNYVPPLLWLQAVDMNLIDRIESYLRIKIPHTVVSLTGDESDR